MKRKTLWLVLGCLMVLALLVASCAPATAPPAEKSPTPPTETPKVPSPGVVTEKVVEPKTTEEPQYGGTITVVGTLLRYDPYRYESGSNVIQGYCFEKLVIADWGVDRKEYDFPTARGGTILKYLKGLLLDRWEVPDPLTIIGHVRKGVKFQDKPPVNGREFTADDVIFNIQRYIKSPFVMGHVYDQYIDVESTKALDKYTVQIKFKPPPRVELVRGNLDNESFYFIAKETVGPSGEIEDWRKMIGTGPFIIADHVPDSSTTFKKNPNYWGYDELHPKNRLPYADSVKFLVLPDRATALAALRTAKIDRMGGLRWQEADSLAKTTPELLQRRFVHSAPAVFRMRNDYKPFTDVRVRQALNMAIDRLEIVNTFYGGYALPYSGLINPVSVDVYTPWDKLPPNVRKVLDYNPEGAKKLLAEAGYPNGFKTHIDYAFAAHLPEGLSEILQSYLAKIGVDAELKLYEYGAFNTLRLGKKHTQIIIHWNSQYTNPLHLMGWFADPTNQYNLSQVDDPVFTAKYGKAMGTLDDAERAKLTQELDYYSLEQAFFIAMPYQQEVTMWHPWLKGFRGEGALGEFAYGALDARLWVDQSLKEKLTGRK